MLKSIGIEKGKTFNPDPTTQADLERSHRRSARLARQPLRSYLHDILQRRTAVGASGFAGVAEGMMSNFANPNAYPVDGRGVAYSMAFFSAKHLGAGQYYLMTIRDKDRKPFDGSGTYRLNVPANAPVKLYWSATAYDRATHALIRNQPHSSRASTTPGLAEKRRRLGGRLFRPESAGGQGVELGADQRGRKVRSPVSPLRTREAVLRQDVGAAGHREDRLRKLIVKTQRHVFDRVALALRRQQPPVAQTTPTRRRPGHRRQLHPRRDRHVFRRSRVERRRLRQVRAPPRTGADRQPDRHPDEPRHALFGGGVRPRCRTGDDHTARSGQAIHVDADHQ